MPLSFVSILGGTVTLMGTSTNLVVHGEAMRRGFDELGMFSITPLGLICLAVGLLYLFTAGRVLLPRRARAPDLSSKYDIRRFVTELHVPGGFAGQRPLALRTQVGRTFTTSRCWISNGANRRLLRRTEIATYGRVTSSTCRGPPNASSTSRDGSDSETPRVSGKEAGDST